MTERDDSVWFGFLEAGPRSSPVVRDDTLHTSHAENIYLFNLQRGTFLEYRRAIVEAKLRELGPDEAELAEQLREAFLNARCQVPASRNRHPRPSPRPSRRAVDELDPEAGDDTDEEAAQIPDDWDADDPIELDDKDHDSLDSEEDD